MEKKCTKCGEVKSLDEFNNAKKGKHGKDSRCRSCGKLYYKSNKERIKQIQKGYYLKNKLKIDKKIKEYGTKNKEKIRKYITLYHKNRRDTDPLFKLRLYTSKSVRGSLLRKGYGKKTKTYNILKCEYDFFNKWLNGKASNGYTYGIEDLHLDHVIPISLAETEEEILLLCHYSNYQLLTADENLAKSNSYVNPTNLKRVLEHHPNPDKIREIHARL